MNEFIEMKPCEACDGSGWEEDVDLDAEITKAVRELYTAAERSDERGYYASVELQGFLKAQRLYVRLMKKTIREVRAGQKISTKVL